MDKRSYLPKDVQQILERLDADRDGARADAERILMKAEKAEELKTQILRYYGVENGHGLSGAKTNSKSAVGQEETGSPDGEAFPFSDVCPLSVDDMRRTGEPMEVVAALAKSTSDRRINETQVARWLTAAGVADRGLRAFRMWVRRQLQRRQDQWLRLGDGDWRFIEDCEESVVLGDADNADNLGAQEGEARLENQAPANVGVI